MYHDIQFKFAYATGFDFEITDNISVRLKTLVLTAFF